MAKGREFQRTRRRAAQEEDDEEEKEEKVTIIEKTKSFFTDIKERNKDTWIHQNWWVILILIGLFLFGFFLRAYFYYPLANETGFSGNDPYYHKRVVDFVQEEHQHLQMDKLLNYPVNAPNPRPPMFDWSLAILGFVFGPIFGFNVAQSTNSMMYLAPSFWGALTVVPTYLIGKDMFGKKAGLLGAFFMATMASHVERSPAGFSDHDAIVVFFVVTGIYFLFKSFSMLEGSRDQKWVRDWKRPRDIYKGLELFFSMNKTSVYYSLLSGFSILAIALTWKGFPYAMVIILIYYVLQLLIDRFKGQDSLPVFILVFIAIGVALLGSFPYYYTMSLSTWVTPFYFILAVVAIGVMLIPTRDYPWLVVLPVGIILVITAYLLLGIVSPETSNAIFSGQGYFIKSKLYSTIAEAQPPQFSRLVVSYSIVVFFLALIGIVKAAIGIPKHWNKSYLFIIIWTVVATYMAMSAVRFMFNATPVICIAGGWMCWQLIDKLNKRAKFLLWYSTIGFLALFGLGIWAYNYELGTKYTWALFTGCLAIVGVPILVAVFDYYGRMRTVISGAVLVALWIITSIIFLIMDKDFSFRHPANSLLENSNILLFGIFGLAITILPVTIFLNRRRLGIFHMCIIVSITMLALFLSNYNWVKDFIAHDITSTLFGWYLIPFALLAFNVYLMFMDKKYSKKTATTVLFIALEFWYFGLFFSGGKYNVSLYMGLVVSILFLLNLVLFMPDRESYKDRIKPMQVLISLFVVVLILVPNLWFAVDASLPHEKKEDANLAIYYSIPDGVRPEPEYMNKYMGAFGHSFTQEYWRNGFKWLSEQDNDEYIEDRPGFVSWWDYGFWCTYLGDHPTCADNFQNGYQFAGSFIAAQNESEAVSLMIARILEAGYYQREKGDEINDLLLDQEYFGNEKRYESTMSSDMLDGAGLIREMIFYPDEYVDIIKDNPEKYGKYLELLAGNARYAAVRALLIEHFDEETLIILLKDIEDVTDYSIRYFAADYRLFPFSAQNTGIFYAPIKLADRDVNDFLQYIVVTEEGEMPIEDVEARLEVDPEFREKIIDYRLKYTDKFYNSMFFRCYIGYSGEDLGIGDQGVPVLAPYNNGSFDTNQGRWGTPEATERANVANTFRPMQGWNMTHFKLVYKTVYYSPKTQEEGPEWPDDFSAINSVEAAELYQEQGGTQYFGLRNGVCFLQYYHGAFVEGQVLGGEEDSKPVPNVRVTVTDEFGIPHDVTYTDSEGYYNLTVPFGDINIIASTGGWPEDAATLAVSQITNVEKDVLNSTQLTITDDQAMRVGNDWVIEKDLYVKSKTLNGTVFMDIETNDAFDEEQDTLLIGANISLSSLDRDLVYEIQSDNDGFYNIENIIPGKYQVDLLYTSHTDTVVDELEFTVDGESITQDIALRPSEISGNMSFENGTGFPNLEVYLLDELEGIILSRKTNETGAFQFENLFPGNYTLETEITGYKYFSVNFTLDQGELNSTNYTLYQITPVEGKVWYDFNKDGYSEEMDPLPYAWIQFINLENRSLSYDALADENGNFRSNLSQGKYSIYIIYLDNENVYSYLEGIDVELGEELNLDLQLRDSILISGNLGLSLEDIENSTTINQEILISSDKGTYSAVTNSSSYYRAWVPKASYTISAQVDLITGTYMDMMKIDPDAEPGVTEFYANLKAEIAHRVEGWVFWDIDGDQNISIDGSVVNIVKTTDATDPDGSTEELEITPISTRNGETGTEDLYDTGDVDIDIEGDIGDNQTKQWETLDEVVAPITLTFRTENGFIVTETNSTGYYELYLPKGKYELNVLDPRFEAYSLSFEVSNLSQNKNNVLVTPTKIPVEIKAGIDLDRDGVLEERELLEEFPIIFKSYLSLEDKLGNLTSPSFEFQFGSNDKKVAMLDPGNYKALIGSETVEYGMKIRRTAENNISILLGSPGEVLELLVFQEIYFNGTARLENGNVASNTTITLRSTHDNTEYIIRCNENGEFYYGPIYHGLIFIKNTVFKIIFEQKPGIIELEWFNG